jgi:hypothetical protein
MNKHSSNFILAFGYNVHNPVSLILKDSFGEWKCFFFEEDMDNGKVYSVFITENQLPNIPYPIVDIIDDILDLKKIKFFVEDSDMLPVLSNELPMSENVIQNHILSIN